MCAQPYWHTTKVAGEGLVVTGIGLLVPGVIELVLRVGVPPAGSASRCEGCV